MSQELLVVLGPRFPFDRGAGLTGEQLKKTGICEQELYFFSKSPLPRGINKKSRAAFTNQVTWSAGVGGNNGKP